METKTIDFGTVEFFDSRENKMYGFISTGDGSPDIWFHFNDARKLEAQDEEVVFIDEPHTNLALPRVGESVVFERAAGKGGKPKACPWNYRRNYTAEAAILEARAIEAERNADLHQKAMQAGDDSRDELVIPDTVFTDHASDSDDEESEECTVCGRTTGCNCKDEECIGCHELLRDCTCAPDRSCGQCGQDPCICDEEEDYSSDDQEFENNSEPPDADVEFFDIEEAETPDIEV